MPKCPAWREGGFGLTPFSYDRCYATKEMETCECLGNEAFCDFYPEKRKAAIKPKNGEWISVKERLPELEQEVLVYAVGKEDGFEDSAHIAISQRYVFHVFSWDKGVEEWRAPWAYFNKNYSVTHWMPLPEAPKEE